MRFIVIDGLDGAGKDTHGKLIKKRYENMGEKVIFRSHPEDDNPYGRKAKKALLEGGKINHLKASIYYALDVIRSLRLYYWSNPGADTIIFVRYLMGVAYLPSTLARILYHIFSFIFPTTEYMFFLDVSPQEALKRLQERNEHEMFENFEDLGRVREKALKLAKDWHIINTEKPIKQVQKKINKILDKLDQKKGIA
ncbi:MAG: thymidylate kinase [Methanothermobacter sp.]